MKIKASLGLQDFPKILRILMIIALILGIFWRFYNLDVKVFSNDETFSLTNIFGRNLVPVIDVKIVTAGELQTYQKFNPQETLTASFTRLIEKPYVFPPLYSMLMEVWARLTSPFLDSNPAITTRSLSALISLFSLIGVYWLSWELSASKTMCWIATVLIAVSPFHFQYSQIVRTYSLTTAAILLSSAALIRSMRLQTISSWATYAITVATGLYSNILFAFVVISHSFYTLVKENIRFTKTLKFYIVSALIGIIIFLPWLFNFLSTPSLLDYSVAQPVGGRLSLLSWLKIWMTQIRTIFIDLNDPWIESTKALSGLQKLLSILILILVPISLYFISRKPRESVNLLSLCLIIFGGVLLMAKDIILGGTFSNRIRYMIPYVIGLQLSVAYFLTSQLQSLYNLRRKISQVVLAILIIGGTISCGVIATNENWWAFGVPDYHSIARRLHQEPNAITVFEDWGDALTMSYLLPANTSFHLTRRLDYHLVQEKGNMYKKFEYLIVFKPSESVVNKLKSHFELKELFENEKSSKKTPKNVWKIKLNNSSNS